MSKKVESEPSTHEGKGDGHASVTAALVPIMVFKKIEDEGNSLGYDKIEILTFNYDGSGSALALLDGELGSVDKDELSCVLFGDPGSGDRYYELTEG